ncbi:hypothetical protein [Gimesia maris]|uniref:hypothetical protein n=1 Tax=Gimesia maris TaxID=122 RepID=UPI00015424F6|nr:hypothetical protein [Gimesia maris]EDL58263.1 hypothetical protein PM8797T_17047 [Gimesia maris DSM 8797]
MYTLDQFKTLAGLQHCAFQNAVKKGLKTITIGRRKYVRGSDFLAFLDKQAEAQEAATAL